jgi:hypothetical protein
MVAVERNGRTLAGAPCVGPANIPASGVPGDAPIDLLRGGAPASSRLRTLIITAIVFSPILATVVRKFILYSDAIFLMHYASLTIILGLLMLRSGAYRLVPQNLFTVTCLVVAWICIQAPLTGVSPLALSIAISTYAIPVVALYLSVVTFATTPRLPVYSFWTAAAILIASYGLGILQINSDPDSVFNYMPPGVEISVAAYGISGELNVDIGYIVRPVSIYMHPGQFGSVVFVLSLFRLFYMYSANYSSARIVLQVLVVDLPAFIVSGQRAASLIYVPVLLVVILRRGDTTSWIALLGSFILFIVASGADFVPWVLLYSIDVGAERITSGVSEIPSRLGGNLVGPASVILEHYFLIGEGPGLFTSGMRNLAGSDQADQYVFMIGENGWLRIAAEVGVIGMSLYAWMLWTLGAVGMWVSKRFFNYLTLFCLGIAVWANTHDLFNNYVMMWQGFLLGGIVLLDSRSGLTQLCPFPSPYDPRVRQKNALKT